MPENHHTSKADTENLGFTRLMILMAVYAPIALAIILFAPFHLVRLFFEKYSMR